MFNTHKWSNLALIIGLSGILMLQYQNCAPAPQTQMTGIEQTGGATVGLPVSVIDQVNTGGLAFVEKNVAVPSQNYSVALNGICNEEQSGATLRWELRDSEGNDLASGYAKCDQGGFRVELAPVQSLACGTAYKLVAFLGVTESDAVEIKRDCL